RADDETTMHDDQHAARESPEAAAEEADKAMAELPEQLARARAVVRQAREQLSIHMSSQNAEDGV
ncbi:MAG TPA: hypothetical protein VF699_04605, partial [Caulobacteraceae bacterium]